MDKPTIVQPIKPESATEEELIDYESIKSVINHIPQLFGINVLMLPGEEWETIIYTDGTVYMTYDLRYFTDRGYTLDQAVYATAHEVAAHVREAMWEPELTRLMIDFVSKEKGNSIFHNILADIAGNHSLEARLPQLVSTGRELYSQHLFPDDGIFSELPGQLDNSSKKRLGYNEHPRHLQFLYKIIRQEMNPGSFTEVFPEVDRAIERLRQYQDTGQDVIKYSTGIVKPDGTAITPEDRFALWVNIIYPEYQELLELDKRDPNFAESEKSSSDDHVEDNQSGNPNGDKSKPPSDRAQKDSHGHSHDQDGQFAEYYNDYWENKHPEPLSHEDYSKIQEVARKESERNNPATKDRERQEKFRIQTGHTLFEQQSYNELLLQNREAIEAIRELFFKKVLSPQLSNVRRLGNTLRSDGITLSPNHLAEIVADIASGAVDPKAFLDYEYRRTEHEFFGNTDYYLVIDRSSSMKGEKARAAALCALIFLEGLDGIQTDIRDTANEHGIDLGLGIRSAVYGFGESAELIKPLGPDLTTKERLDCYQRANNPLNEGTADYLVLQAIHDEKRDDKDRKRVIIVMSDGESSNNEEAKKILAILRLDPQTTVYGISIGSDKAVELYFPDALRCDDPADLPETLATLLEATI